MRWHCFIARTAFSSASATARGTASSAAQRNDTRDERWLAMKPPSDLCADCSCAATTKQFLHATIGGTSAEVLEQAYWDVTCACVSVTG
jgi:hypothetical protein